ncbi:hypothetical protein AZ013_002177 [Citrobacter freundii]|nr:hypothetical protein AZ013_002177 [Citrobacter freundii]
MNSKAISLNVIWGTVSFVLIIIFSPQDKEWFIDGLGVNNICDLMTYVESDDIRDAGIIFTLPLFIPYIYVIAYRKQRSFWQLLTVTVLVCFWLWRFFLRYQFCL